MYYNCSRISKTKDSRMWRSIIQRDFHRMLGGHLGVFSLSNINYLANGRRNVSRSASFKSCLLNNRTVQMSALTEETVLQRTKCKELEHVRKLNVWGIGIKDVSVFRRMPNLEIASCSVNNISTLADFAHCPHLQELYIRKNEITDLAEISFLKNLHELTNLWLLDNPCSSHNNYRLTVLKHLPHLQKLDNVAVSKEELKLAAESGDELPLQSSKAESSSAVEPQLYTSLDDGCMTEEAKPSSNVSFSTSNPEKDQKAASRSVKDQDKKATSADELEEEEEDKELLNDSRRHKLQNNHQNTNQQNSRILDALILLIEELNLEELIAIHEAVSSRIAALT